MNKTNWDLVSFDQALFNTAFKELADIYISKGLDPNEIGFKEIAEYVNEKPYPYTGIHKSIPESSK